MCHERRDIIGYSVYPLYGIVRTIRNDGPRPRPAISASTNSLDDRSLSSRQAGKNYHRKSRARNGTTEYAPGATRGLPACLSLANRYHTVCLFRLTASATFLPVISPLSSLLLFLLSALRFLLTFISFLLIFEDKTRFFFPLPASAPSKRRKNQHTGGGSY